MLNDACFSAGHQRSKSVDSTLQNQTLPLFSDPPALRDPSILQHPVCACPPVHSLPPAKHHGSSCYCYRVGCRLQRLPDCMYHLLSSISLLGLDSTAHVVDGRPHGMSAQLRNRMTNCNQHIGISPVVSVHWAMKSVTSQMPCRHESAGLSAVPFGPPTACWRWARCWSSGASTGWGDDDENWPGGVVTLRLVTRCCLAEPGQKQCIARYCEVQAPVLPQKMV